jgi:hypothetical protein
MASRQEEIQEFAAMLNALTKKYNVRLNISIEDIEKKELEVTKNENIDKKIDEALEGEVVK